MNRARAVVVCFLLSLLAVCRAPALNANTHISQYGHAVWRVQEGYFNGYPSAFAQTPDGYLWVGTPAGVYRFDGASFTAMEPPVRKLSTAEVRSMYVARDGSLWVGFAGWISHWDGEMFASPILTNGVATGFAEDQDGAIWFSRAAAFDHSGPICKVTLDKFHCYGQAEGIQLLGATGMKTAKQGHLWAVGGRNMIEWDGKPVGEYSLDKLEKSDPNSGISALEVDPSGTVWIASAGLSSGSQLRRLVNGKWELYTVPGLKTENLIITRLFFDREGCLWLGTVADGLYRIHGDSVDHYGRVDGLSSDDVTAIFQDREGSVWVATSEGVDHFYDMPVVSYSNKQGLGGPDAEAVLGRRDGSIAVLSIGSIYSIRGSTITPLFKRSGKDTAIVPLLEDYKGDLWFCDVNGALVVLSSSGIRTIVKGDGTEGIGSLAEDTDHNVWASFSGLHPRLVRIEGGQVREEFDPPNVPAAYTIIADPHQGIWLAGFGKQLMRYNQGKWQSLQLDVLLKRYGSIAAIFNMAFDADGTLWGSNSWGVIAYRNGKLQFLDDRNGLPCNSTFSVIFDRHDDLWMQASCGLIRIAHSELERWLADPEAKIKASTFAAVDGFRSGVPSGRPAATRSSDGRLWFQNRDVVMMVDPDHLAYNPIVLPVHVQQVIADRIDYAVKDGLRLPIKTRQLELDYTGLSLVMPAKVQFRYMLEGHDTQWQDPGTRRAAFYNDLPPGHYTFRVIAANNSGLWNMQGASLRLTIPPAYYQTNWFRVLCVAIALLIVWFFYRMRVRQVAHAMSVRFDERLSERTRLARDLHDTLLQTIQGSKLVADSALKQSPEPTPMRSAVEQLSAWLGRATEEGREALNSLRASTTETNDLAEALQLSIEECRRQSSITASFSVTGEVSEMHPIVRDEVYRIGYESIHNACVHSQAAQLQVDLTYAGDLILRVRDNGVGIDPSIVDGGKEGHFGLQGMRERARRILAALTVETSSATGTEIKLVVPGSIIYRKPTHPERKSSAIKSLFKRMGLTSSSTDI